MKSIQTLGKAGVVATIAAAGTAWAQTCSYEITTAAVPVPANVPSLSLLGVALLAAAVGFLAWRQGKFPGARLMAVALLAGAALLANQGGGGLVQRAYAATLEVLLSNPAGETQGAVVANGDTILFRNTSGASLRVSSITPAPAACGEGTVIPPGETCATTASCPVEACDPGYELIDGVCVPVEPVQCAANEVENPMYPTPPNQQCICGDGYARNTAIGVCVPQALCESGTVEFSPTGENVCVPL